MRYFLLGYYNNKMLNILINNNLLFKLVLSYNYYFIHFFKGMRINILWRIIMHINKFMKKLNK